MTNNLDNGGQPPKKRNGFTQVDNGLFPGHSPAGKTMLIALDSHADDYIPTYRQLADQTGMSYRNVHRVIKKLADSGTITQTGTGRNKTKKWKVNRNPVGTKEVINKNLVMTNCHDRSGQNVITALCIEDNTNVQDKQYKGEPETNSKIDTPLPACKGINKQAFNNRDNVYKAKQIQPYFKGFINYETLNKWMARMTAAHGADAHQKFCGYFETQRAKARDDHKQWPFTDYNLRILEELVFPVVKPNPLTVVK